ncbi:helix-turn-helix transcriptional regulator [Planctomonas sp. JC2975]|uniref:helix-turn-helix domain-containing protein n=1 Tax=Planctomonas sp. JC2975 TaxID=2729626 RepID=UPI00147524FF|nr:helix-turn-helix transcriptional regulator [Planctomonas sp. JC2975]NNC11133.1 helix-turn-helix transcriptional regulator [Planctomonas sp. JC2975]
MVEPFSHAAGVVGERLRGIRIALDLSQEQVAHLADLHPTNYGKIERGRANPSLSTIIRIATALDTDAGQLISGLTIADLPGRHRQYTAKDFIRERERMR